MTIYKFLSELRLTQGSGPTGDRDRPRTGHYIVLPSRKFGITSLAPKICLQMPSFERKSGFLIIAGGLGLMQVALSNLGLTLAVGSRAFNKHGQTGFAMIYLLTCKSSDPCPSVELTWYSSMSFCFSNLNQTSAV